MGSGSLSCSRNGDEDDRAEQKGAPEGRGHQRPERGLLATGTSPDSHHKEDRDRRDRPEKEKQKQKRKNKKKKRILKKNKIMKIFLILTQKAVSNKKYMLY